MSTPVEKNPGEPLDFGGDIAARLEAVWAKQVDDEVEANWRDAQNNIEHDIAWANNTEKVGRYARNGLRDVEAARIAGNHILLLSFFERVQFDACYPGVDSMSFDYDSVDHLSYHERNAVFDRFYAKMKRYLSDPLFYKTDKGVAGSLETLSQSVRNLTFVTLPEPDAPRTSYKPSITPLWVVGSHDTDGGATRYLAVAIDANLPSEVQNYIVKTDEDEPGWWEYVDPDDVYERFEDIEYWTGFSMYDEPPAKDACDSIEYFLHGYMGQRYNFGTVVFSGPPELKQPKLTAEDVDRLRREDNKGMFDVRPNAIASLLSPGQVTEVKDLSRIYLTEKEMLRFNVRPNLMRMATDLSIEHHLQRLSDEVAARQQVLSRIIIEELFEPFVDRTRSRAEILERLPNGCISVPEHIDMSPKPSDQSALSTNALIRLAMESSRIISEGLVRNDLSVSE